MTKKFTLRAVTLIAVCIGINYIGGTIALWLRLPIYLDSIGTIFAGALLGPFFGALAGFLSGLLSGMTTDIFSLYYSPIQIITGLIAGLLLHQRSTSSKKYGQLIWKALLISLPGTVISSLITVKLFGGITSSGSSILVQLLSGLGMNQLLSVTIVQAGTDYLDRLLSLIVVTTVIASLPKTILKK